MTHQNNYPWRRVKRWVFCQSPYSKAGCGTILHVLECGHSIHEKKSKGYRRRKRCRDCGLGR